MVELWVLTPDYAGPPVWRKVNPDGTVEERSSHDFYAADFSPGDVIEVRRHASPVT